jgi:hypothetical protein
MHLEPIFPMSTPTNNGRLVHPLPRYARVDEAHLPPMRLTERDKRILETVHAYDGLLSDVQIQQLFFTGKSAMQVRLMLLYQHGYLNRPNRRQRAALPTMIYWLGEKGAEYVAGLQGVPFSEFSWHKEPRFAQVEHDLAVNDVRIAFLKACTDHPDFTLEEWIPASEFHAHPDKIEFFFANRTKSTRFMRPDGFCVVTKGTYTSRLLLELDRASEDNPRLVREKILPGVAYLRSDAYKARFGYTSGRWLFVTTSERRLKNMKRMTENAAKSDAKLFYFTTIDRITPETLLNEPIWWRGGEMNATSLFSKK